METITLNGQTYNVNETPELKALLDSAKATASKEEKDKLYAALNERDKKIETLVKNVSELKKTLETKPAEKPIETTQVATQVQVPSQDDIAAIVKAQVEATLAASMAPLQNQLQSVQSENLTAYRTRRIAELGDQVIPEMIQGNTFAEIEKSIESSKAIRSRYNIAASTTTTETTTTPPANPQTPENKTPETPVVTTPVAEKVVTPIQVLSLPPLADGRQRQMDPSKMTDKEWEEVRETYFQQVKTAMQQQ